MTFNQQFPLIQDRKAERLQNYTSIYLIVGLIPDPQAIYSLKVAKTKVKYKN